VTYLEILIDGTWSAQGGLMRIASKVCGPNFLKEFQKIHIKCLKTFPKKNV